MCTATISVKEEEIRGARLKIKKKGPRGEAGGPTAPEATRSGLCQGQTEIYSHLISELVIIIF